MSDLKKAAEWAYQCMTRMLEDGEWYNAEMCVDNLYYALEQHSEQEPAAVVAMDASGVHMSYGGQYLGQKPDTKIAMLLKDLPVGTPLYVAVGMGISNE